MNSKDMIIRIATVSKEINYRIMSLIMLILFAVCLVNCIHNITEISGNEFRIKLMEGTHHSSHSWWVIDEDEYSYILVEKSPLSENHYRVRKNHIKINNLGDYPVNLKSKNIEFLKIKEDENENEKGNDRIRP